jgi:catechol 2,3-dioxygenase-like lactoylglutathione lyase family enzyme
MSSTTRNDRTGCVTRFSHVVINVSDLARSVEFYEATTPLRRDPAPLDWSQLDAITLVPAGDAVGHIMRDHQNTAAPVLLLVQLLAPEPIGQAYGPYNHLGFCRIGFRHVDALAVYGAVSKAGGELYGPPLMPDETHKAGRPIFAGPDPDGVRLQHMTLGGPSSLYHVACGCSDVSATVAFYEALGLEVWLRAANTVPARNAFGPPGEPATYEAALAALPGQTTASGEALYSIDICEWTEPLGVGAPYATQAHIGIVRVGFACDDLVAGATRLAELGFEVKWRGTELPEDSGSGPRFFTVSDPDGAIVELVAESF